MKNSSIVKIQTVAKSPDDAKRCLENVLIDIRLNQDQIFLPIRESKMNRLNHLKNKLKSMEQLLKDLPLDKNTFDVPNPQLSGTTLFFSTIMMSKEKEIRDLFMQINELEFSLSEPQTKEAFFITPIYASDIRIAPKRPRILLISTFVGGLITIGFLIIIKTCRRINVPEAV